MNSVVKEDIKKIIESFSGWERFRDKTILISGANGFLPAYLVETLIELNHVFNSINVNVIALVRNKEKAEKRFAHLLSNKHLKIIVKDVCDEIVNDHYLDYLFFLIRSPIFLLRTIQVQTDLPLFILENISETH